MGKTAQTVFKRTEKKYLVSAAQFRRLSVALGAYMKADEYGEYTICNIYFDTETDALIRRSLEKPVFKEKIRARSYGVPTTDSKVFLEIKRKFKGVVYKRRVSMQYGELQTYLQSGEHPQTEKNKQIFAEIDYFFQFYHPTPKLWLAYDRVAFQGREIPSLRITFDHDIRYRETDLTLGAGDDGIRLLPDGQYVMEIKADGAMPLWLCDLLDGERLYPVSFSKYGNVYKTIHQRREV
ncbi:MAG: polyphosphate polymerase domain-containing protein [Candidatus Fimenecus sp.]